MAVINFKEAIDQSWQQHREKKIMEAELLIHEALAEQSPLQVKFLEAAAETATSMVPTGQLLECCSRFNPSAAHRSVTLLELIIDEPFFTAVSRELAKKLAAKISAEESAPQLNIMVGMPGDEIKTLPKEEPGLTAHHRTGINASLQVRNNLAECNLVVHETEQVAQSPPTNDKNWERLYCMLAPFELLLTRLEEAEVQTIFPEGTAIQSACHCRFADLKMFRVNSLKHSV